MKKIKIVFIGVLSLSILTGCSDKITETKKEENTSKVQSKCEITDCMKSITIENTPEEINEIMGFEAEQSKNGEEDKFTWKLDNKNYIILTETTSPMIQATIEKSTIKNENLDFSIYNDLKEDLNKGKSYTYKEMVEKLGGIEGILAGKTTSSDRYIWVDKNERTFSATFSLKHGKCTIISLR